MTNEFISFILRLVLFFKSIWYLSDQQFCSDKSYCEKKVIYSKQ